MPTTTNYYRPLEVNVTYDYEALENVLESYRFAKDYGMNRNELERFREALIELAERCRFTYTSSAPVSPPEAADIFDSDGVRYRHRGSDRLVKNFDGTIMYYDGSSWYRRKPNRVAKVALCPK